MPATPECRRRRAAAALTLACVLGAACSPEPGANAGALTLTPAAPRPGSTIALRYRPPGTLAREPHLFAVGAVAVNLTPAAPPARLARLDRQPDGTFAGTLRLPDSASLLRVTVASPDGRRTDDNAAQPWELGTVEPDGRPRFEALWARYAAHDVSDWERAYAAAREMLRTHPGRPEGLRFVVEKTLELTGPAARDSVLGAHRAAYHALHDRLAASRPDANVVAQMAMLSARFGDAVRLRYWRERGVREFPADPGVVQQRVFAAFEGSDADADRLAALERLWGEVGGRAPQLLFDGFSLATKTADSAAVARWGARVLRTAPWWRGMVASAYTQVAPLRPAGIALLRAQLADLPPAGRPDWAGTLRAGTAGAEPAAREARALLRTLGEALLGQGRAAAARDTLARAASLGWDPDVFRLLGDAALASHDRDGALRAYAWLAADPRTPAAARDSVLRRAGAPAAGAAWRTEVAEARRVLDARTRAGATRRAFDATARVTDAAGRPVRVGDAAGRGTAVVAFVSRTCAPSLADLPGLARAAAELRGLGVPLLTVVAEVPSEDARTAIARRGYGGPLAFDERAALSRALRRVGTPHYFVVDGGRAVRFESRRADELPLLVRALRGT